MELGSPEWIEASLAKLDNLERQRDDHEEALEASSDPVTLKQHSDAVTRLDAEIKSLYAQLEAVADEDDEAEELEASDAVLPRVTQGDDENSAPHAVAPAVAPSVPASVPVQAAAPVKAAPVEASPSVAAAAADNPFASPSPAPDSFGGGAGFDAAPMAFDDSDLKPKGGGGKWAFLAVVVAAGVGVGGYFAWQNMQAQKQDQPKAEAAPEQVIKAAEVPEDTEAPNAIKGADATISPNADGGDSGGGGGGGSKKKVDEKKTKPIKLKVGEDPLG